MTYMLDILDPSVLYELNFHSLEVKMHNIVIIKIQKEKKKRKELLSGSGAIVLISPFD